LEKQPLLTKLTRSVSTTFGAVEESKVRLAQEDSKWDSSEYDMSLVISWRIIFVMAGGAFDNLSILKVMLGSLLISIGVACFTCGQSHAIFIKMDKVHTLGTFLNVFVGMLLGFFVSSAMYRWYGCVHGFMELLEAIRCLQMQMFALGVEHEKIEKLNRYGLLSAWLLHFSLNSGCSKNPRLETETKSEAQQKEELWNKLEENRPHLVHSQEKALLFHYKDCYGLLWTWVASFIGRMAQDGEIPPMASPTYGRIINIVEWAYGSIRDIRSLHRIKAPFIYVHTMCVLVHVNTMLNSLSFGLVLGTTVQVALGSDNSPYMKKLPRMVAGLFMQFCIGMVAPFLYLCLLEVSVCISQPFTFMDSKIPSANLLLRLEDDLNNSKEFADNTKWEKPRFKK